MQMTIISLQKSTRYIIKIEWLVSRDKHIHLLQSVEPSHSPTTEATRRPENISKNRYANITACELFLQYYYLVLIILLLNL